MLNKKTCFRLALHAIYFVIAGAYSYYTAGPDVAVVGGIYLALVLTEGLIERQSIGFLVGSIFSSSLAFFLFLIIGYVVGEGWRFDSRVLAFSMAVVLFLVLEYLIQSLVILICHPRRRG